MLRIESRGRNGQDAMQGDGLQYDGDGGMDGFDDEGW